MLLAPGSLSTAPKPSQHRARAEALVARTQQQQPQAARCSMIAASACKGAAADAAPSNHQLHGAPFATAAAVAAVVVLQTTCAGSAAAAGELQQQLHQPLAVQQQQQELHHPQQQQQQLQQQVCRQPQLRAPPLHALADLAGDFFGSSPDLPDPFTLYGTNLKSYSIEQLQGEKVVSRSRGFTVTTCVSGKAASEEGPLFNGLPLGAKVDAGDGLLCTRATGQDLKAVCKQSCGSACEAGLAAYEARYTADTGLTLDAKERARVLKNCRHSCAYECTKSGRYHDFAVPSRR